MLTINTKHIIEKIIEQINNLYVLFGDYLKSEPNELYSVNINDLVTNEDIDAYTSCNEMHQMVNRDLETLLFQLYRQILYLIIIEKGKPYYVHKNNINTYEYDVSAYNIPYEYSWKYGKIDNAIIKSIIMNNLTYLISVMRNNGLSDYSSWEEHNFKEYAKTIVLAILQAEYTDLYNKLTLCANSVKRKQM